MAEEGFKVCKSCKRELPLNTFAHRSNSKDGYSNVCKECKTKFKGGNSELAKFTPRELMDELKVRGYKGELKYVTVHTIVI